MLIWLDNWKEKKKKNNPPNSTILNSQDLQQHSQPLLTTIIMGLSEWVRHVHGLKEAGKAGIMWSREGGIQQTTCLESFTGIFYFKDLRIFQNYCKKLAVHNMYRLWKLSIHEKGKMGHGIQIYLKYLTKYFKTCLSYKPAKLPPIWTSLSITV